MNEQNKKKTTLSECISDGNTRETRTYNELRETEHMFNGGVEKRDEIVLELSLK